MLVRELMTPLPITVRRDTPIKQALKLLLDHHITALPVVSSAGRLCGMVSEVDLMRERVLEDPRAHELPLDQESLEPPAYVEEVMTPTSAAVREDDEAAKAVRLMTDLSLKSLPVLGRDEELVGMVSRSDVVRALARDDAAIAQQVAELMADLGHPDWRIDVRDGMVEVTGPERPTDRSLAQLASSTVPGVVRVRVT
jgi:CBS-domain-containing membrane protein